MGKMKYKMSSRTAILLGRDSVTKPDSAIIELIKNSYDADADFSYIKFDLVNDCLYILDNGIGMTEDIIENNWMVIGTDNKVMNYESSKSRIKSGEKGVGRLALDRLGEVCEMYTKNKGEKLNYWKIDFSQFEVSGRLLEDVDVEFEKLTQALIDTLPNDLLNDLSVDESLKIKSLETGTLLIIRNLRDKWNEIKIDELFDSLSFLVPPKETFDYELFAYSNKKSKIEVLKNDITSDFDYKINSKFDGEKFNIKIHRNEWDKNKIPKNLQDENYLKSNLPDLVPMIQDKVTLSLTIDQLFNKYPANKKQVLKDIGKFEFNFLFLKSNNSQQDPSYFVKDIGPKRKIWLNMHTGIKIYRDNFIVRPYGFIESNSFDWLGLDHRKNKSPASPSHEGGGWRVRNKQVHGSLSISRIFNPQIKDISSRESLVDNEEFEVLKEALHKIISMFERDRATIFYALKKYNENLNEVEIMKKEAEILARKIEKDNDKAKLNKKVDLTKISQEKMIDLYNKSEEKNVAMAKAIKYFKEEKDELFSDLKLLRELSTSGLITTSIIHDLKTLGSSLEARAGTIREAIELDDDDDDDEDELDNVLKNLKSDDLFLKAWIEVIINENKDKRKRRIHDLREVISNVINMIIPITIRKGIQIKTIFPEDDVNCNKKIYASDFNSIFYNLIINSMEAFENYNRGTKEIVITLTIEQDNVKIMYGDNGSGIKIDTFANKNEIFNFGVTSKRDRDGEVNGTGLGMYIVSSTLNEYSAKYKIIDSENGFQFEMNF